MMGKKEKQALSWVTRSFPKKPGELLLQKFERQHLLESYFPSNRALAMKMNGSADFLLGWNKNCEKRILKGRSDGGISDR